MHLALDINQREVQRASNVNEGFSKFAAGIGIFFLVLFAPVLVLFLGLAYAVSFKANRELKKLLDILKAEEGKHEPEAFAHLQELLRFTGKWLDKHRDNVADAKEDNTRILQGLKKQYILMFGLMEQIHDLAQQSLYVDGSDHSFSNDEISELEDFFGPSEDYEEDTFLQLNPSLITIQGMWSALYSPTKKTQTDLLSDQQLYL